MARSNRARFGWAILLSTVLGLCATTAPALAPTAHAFPFRSSIEEIAGPGFPWSPFGAVGPLAPLVPVGPVAPLGPGGPAGPASPFGPAGTDCELAEF